MASPMLPQSPRAGSRPPRTSGLAAARDATLDAIGAVERARFTLTRSRLLGNSDHPAARALMQAMYALLNASEALDSQAPREPRQATA